MSLKVLVFHALTSLWPWLSCCCWPSLTAKLLLATGTEYRGVCLLLLGAAKPWSPSRICTSKRFAGSSSTVLTGTGARHSGQSSWELADSCLCRQLIQKVCWQGRTLADTSSCSKHRGHSSKAIRGSSSILKGTPLLESRVSGASGTLWSTILREKQSWVSGRKQW